MSGYGADTRSETGIQPISCIFEGSAGLFPATPEHALSVAAGAGAVVCGDERE
jgi:hypothetical protein